MTNVNEGHRNRLRERMINEGLQNFQDHEVLELLLFQYLPRKDTNKIAHDLLNKFGNFANVLDASPEQLMTVKGISQTTACNLVVLKEVFLRYRRSATAKTPLSKVSAILKYTQELMAYSSEEKLIVAYLDGGNNLILTEEFTSHNTQRVDVDLKKLISSALRARASGVMLFHCHVNGECKPSADDKKFTEKVFITLANINIVLLEHIIFNNNGEYYSFYKEKELDRLTLKYKRINDN